jgi:hypothetical protein
MKTTLSVAVLLSFFASCGGGSSSNSGSSTHVGLLVGDAPTDELSSASFAITELRLIREDTSLTTNLLVAPRTLDVLGLGLAGSEALLDLVDLDSGRYTGLRATVDSASIELRDQSGDLVPVAVISAQASADFSSTSSADLILSRDDFASVSLDIVLDQSLRENGPGYDFELVVRAGHGTASPILDDFHGRVTEINRNANWFEVELVDARNQASIFGELRVEVDDRDLLFNHTGAAFGNSNAFLAALKVGDFVEVAGALTQDGTFDGTRCEIEDSSRNQVRLEGRILSVDQGGQTFSMVLEEIEKGYAIAQPVLAALGNPGVLSFAWDNQTSWLGSKSSAGSSGPTDLVAGKKVDVRVDAINFVAPMPFLARNVRVDLDERYEGTVTSIAGLPDRFELTLDNRHPGVTSGRITGPVTVELSSTSVIFIDTGVEAWLDPSDLLTGLEVKAYGKLTGSGASASLAAQRVKVEPGRCEAVVQSVSATQERFTVVVLDRKDPFGDPEPNTTADVVLPSEAVIRFKDGANTFSAFRVAFNGLNAGESLLVDIEGIGDGNGVILGYEVRAEVDED